MLIEGLDEILLAEDQERLPAQLQPWESNNENARAEKPGNNPARGATHKKIKKSTLHSCVDIICVSPVFC